MKSSAMIIALSLAVAGVACNAAESPAQRARAEMRQMFGHVPSFVDTLPEAGIAGAWDELKSIELADDTALSPKTKELIGLAVAAQIPCQYCVYFSTKSAKANGASDEEIKEAIAVAALTRHWSTVFNASQADFATFRGEVDAMLKYAQAHPAPAAATPKK